MKFFRKIHVLVSNTLLLAVYTSFFGVQLFFNFEKFPGEGIAFKPVFQGVAGNGVASNSMLAGLQHISGKSQLPVIPKASVRLNKRFQKENIPPIALVGVEFPVQYALFISALPFDQYRDRLPSWLSSSGNALRGPPLAVY